MDSRIDQFLRKVMSAHQLPGLAIGVVREKQVIFEAGFGVSDFSGNRPITAHSLFHLASISKLFVAIDILQLVEKGGLFLDDPVIQYLPAFKIRSGDYGAITVRQLLSHTSGLPDITDYHWDQPENDPGALGRYVQSLGDVELLSKPGEVFSYSNMGYEILGHLIASVAGTSFEDQIKDSILSPLGMVTSTHLRQSVPADLSVSPHLRMPTTRLSDIYPYHRAHAPSSTLHSSAHEMNIWALTNLNRGRMSAATILAPKSYDELWKPVARVGGANPLTGSVGLGWFLGEQRGQLTVSHSGQDIGFTSLFILLPEAGTGVTVLCNAAPAPTREIAIGILDIIMGYEPAPILPSIMVPLGRVYQESGIEALRRQYKSIQSTLPSAYDFRPEELFRVVSALLDSNQNEDAISLINWVLEDVSPNDAQGFELLARANFQMGNIEAALKYALRSLEINPNNAFLRQQIKPLLGEG